MFSHILVPLDSSQMAESALGPALRIAKTSQGSIHLLSVITVGQYVLGEPATYAMPNLQEQLSITREHCQDYLQTVQQRLQQSGVKAATLIFEGDPAAIILDTAREKDADLIVMTTHGYTGVTRWLLGSVTEKVLREAPCPVLAVRNAKSVSHVLVTLDGSALAESALRPALTAAQALDCRLSLLRVSPEPPMLDSVEIALMEGIDQDMRRYANDNRFVESEEYLNRIAERCRAEVGDQPLPVTTAVRDGPVAPAILEFIEEERVDVVAMATHGRTGLRRWVYGSITEKILRSADTAMLIVRPPAEKLN